MRSPGERLDYAIKKLAGFNKIAPYAEAIGMKPVTVRQQITRGTLTPDAAEIHARKLKRYGVTTDWLLYGRGPSPSAAHDDEPEVIPAENERVPVRSYVGAGDEIISLDDDEPPIDYTAAPPGLDDAEATQVRGLSMLPLYRDGDLLFHHRMTIDPLQLRDEIAIMQTKNRKRFVKIIQPGTKKGTFRLVSINPLYPPIEDQVLVWVSPIVWVRKKLWFRR